MYNLECEWGKNEAVGSQISTIQIDGFSEEKKTKIENKMHNMDFLLDTKIHFNIFVDLTFVI